MRGLAALGAVTVTWFAAGGRQAAPQAPVPWSVGERLEYKVKFGFFNIGRASLQVLGIDTVRGEPCYRVLFTVRGRILSYSLRDSLQSWFGVHDLVSRRFTQDADENGRIRTRHFEILPERGIWIKNGTDTGQTVAEPLDDASFFFYARTLKFENGETYAFSRYFMAERNPVQLTVIGRERINVPAGRFDAVAVRPVFRSGGMFGRGGQAAIWFSDDEARLPLRIRASMVVGTLEISLTSRGSR